MTYPVIANFSTEFAGWGDFTIGRDVTHSLWKIWWYDYSIQNNLDVSHTNFIFYPGGVDVLLHNSFAIFLGLALKQLFNYVQTWNILFFIGYVLGGYSCFLLSNHFKKNFLASIIAGTIFTFGTFHMAHSTVHVGLSTIFWIPLTILFLFRISKNPTKINGIITGILLFFTFFTHMYYGLTMIIFTIIFFIVYFFNIDKKIRIKFISNYVIAVSIFIILILPIIFPIISSLDTNDSFKRGINEHITYSLSVQNLFIAAPDQTFSDFNHSIVLGISSYFDFPSPKSFQVEQLTFLGFSSIILSFIAIFKFRNRYVPFWILIICIFIILSFGPELKIFDESTGISMPSKIGLTSILLESRGLNLSLLSTSTSVSPLIFTFIDPCR